MAKFSVSYDACVLYPAPLRDLLMQLALTDLFKARSRWTDQIHVTNLYCPRYQRIQFDTWKNRICLA